MKELSVIYATLINQYKCRYQTVCSERFDKQNGDNQVIEGTVFFLNLNFNHNLTETDINIIDIKSPLEHQIQQQKMQGSKLRFDISNSMTV